MQSRCHVMTVSTEGPDKLTITVQHEGDQLRMTLSGLCRLQVSKYMHADT